MTPNPAARWAASARALSVALALAKRADWQFEHVGPTLSTPFAGYLYVHVAQLLLVPTTAGLPFTRRLVDAAMREARSDALIISTAAPELTFALGLWRRSQTRWQLPVVPALHEDGELWLTVDGADEVAGEMQTDTAYLLQRSPVMARASPWATPVELAEARSRAEAWLALVIR
ncbi:hypothetical protein [Sphingomonas carotinifaciens]|uniref:Uncharacterized protein n=1 Tax=Sphingomonas carotinifaciens TaxID=1166323 RepID=A0A1G7RT43_9SPHN|nr:hypothetical protein [Sphingomonas carotinifaciens]MBB4088125.1 hypothetical protein [Sphingomonas carotinifaciens]MWC43823.1 hypothetical protein [Sphingomonas carotinifaciens]SDG13824.1 hypothetical protein SAMN05216557_11412 [Sphingomonas carotinifaciens]